MKAIATILLAVMALSVFGQKSAEEKGLEVINRQVLEAQLGFLASDWMEGREAGTAGNYLAGDYLASLIKLYGLQPAGDTETFSPNRYQKLIGAKDTSYTGYFQHFAAIESVPAEIQEMSLTKDNETTRYHYRTDFDVSFVAQSKRVKAPLVFVGYGFENKQLDYNAFKKLDLKGKIVVRLAGMPGDGNPASKAASALAESQLKISAKDKNEQAFERGAVAVLEYNPAENVQKNWTANNAFQYNEAMYEGAERPASFYDKKLRLPADPVAVPQVSISKQVLENLLDGSGFSIEEAIEKGSNLESTAMELGGEMSLSLNAKNRTLGLRNILGVVEGKDTSRIMIVGAHYDHIGTYNGYIFNGADDNGSGAVAVTTIAKAFMATGEKPECTVIFALWDGEERGLLGSRHFIEVFENLGKTILYLNFDMIGRDSGPEAPGNQVAMIYTQAYQRLVDNSKANIEKYGLNLDVNFSGVDRPVGGSDNSGFAKKDIPIFWFHTGGHPDYHKASDHVEMINWKKMEDIVKLSYLNMWQFVNDPSGFER